MALHDISQCAGTAPDGAVPEQPCCAPSPTGDRMDESAAATPTPSFAIIEPSRPAALPRADDARLTVPERPRCASPPTGDRVDAPSAAAPVPALVAAGLFSPAWAWLEASALFWLGGWQFAAALGGLSLPGGSAGRPRRVGPAAADASPASSDRLRVRGALVLLRRPAG